MRLIFPPCVVKSLRCRTHFLPPYNSTFLDGPRGRRIERAVEERRTSRERKRDNGRKRERDRERRKRGQTKGLTRPTIRPRQLVKHWPFPRRDCSASPRLEGGHDDACTTGYERDGSRGERRGWSNRRTNKLEIEEKTLLDSFAFISIGWLKVGLGSILSDIFEWRIWLISFFFVQAFPSFMEYYIYGLYGLYGQSSYANVTNGWVFRGYVSRHELSVLIYFLYSSGYRSLGVLFSPLFYEASYG